MGESLRGGMVTMTIHSLTLRQETHKASSPANPFDPSFRMAGTPEVIPVDGLHNDGDPARARCQRVIFHHLNCLCVTAIPDLCCAKFAVVVNDS
jgi:hypothetical protein